MEQGHNTSNVLVSKVGDKVRFVNPSVGYKRDIDFAEDSGLVVGQVYILSNIDTDTWHTDLYLEGISGCFNSVQFEVA